MLIIKVNYTPNRHLGPRKSSRSRQAHPLAVLRPPSRSPCARQAPHAQPTPSQWGFVPACCSSPLRLAQGSVQRPAGGPTRPRQAPPGIVREPTPTRPPKLPSSRRQTGTADQSAPTQEGAGACLVSDRWRARAGRACLASKLGRGWGGGRACLGSPGGVGCACLRIGRRLPSAGG